MSVCTSKRRGCRELSSSFGSQRVCSYSTWNIKAAELVNRLYIVCWACNISWFIRWSSFFAFQRSVTGFSSLFPFSCFCFVFLYVKGVLAFFKLLKISKEQLCFDKHFWFPFQRICYCTTWKSTFMHSWLWIVFYEKWRKYFFIFRFLSE